MKTSFVVRDRFAVVVERPLPKKSRASRVWEMAKMVWDFVGRNPAKTALAVALAVSVGFNLTLNFAATSTATTTSTSTITGNSVATTASARPAAPKGTPKKASSRKPKNSVEPKKVVEWYNCEMCKAVEGPNTGIEVVHFFPEHPKPIVLGWKEDVLTAEAQAKAADNRVARVHNESGQANNPCLP